jgi:hypothetical protein
MHSITFLACSAGFDLWSLWLVHVMLELSAFMSLVWVGCLVPVWLGDDIIMEGFFIWLHGWREISHRWFTYIKTHVGLQVKCLLLLFNFSQNYNMATDISETCQYDIWRKSMSPFSCCYMQTDINCKVIRRIFATSAAYVHKTSNWH